MQMTTAMTVMTATMTANAVPPPLLRRIRECTLPPLLLSARQPAANFPLKCRHLRAMESVKEELSLSPFLSVSICAAREFVCL